MPVGFHSSVNLQCAWISPYIRFGLGNVSAARLSPSVQLAYVFLGPNTRGNSNLLGPFLKCEWETQSETDGADCFIDPSEPLTTCSPQIARFEAAFSVCAARPRWRTLSPFSKCAWDKLPRYRKAARITRWNGQRGSEMFFIFVPAGWMFELHCAERRKCNLTLEGCFFIHL